MGPVCFFSRTMARGVGVVFMMASGPAFAHHVVAEHGVAPILPQRVVAVEATAASFAHPDHRGSYQVLTPQAEWAFWDRKLSIAAMIPVGRVKVQGRDAEVGVADISASIKGRLLTTPHGGFLLSAGLGVEAPTGDPDKGLGAGHFEVTPFVGISSAFAELGPATVAVFLLSSLRLSAGGEHHHDFQIGSVLAPHAKTELFERAMFALIFARLYLGAGLDAGLPLSHDRDASFAGRAEVGWRLDDGWRLFGATELPVAGEARFDLKVRAGVALAF